MNSLLLLVIVVLVIVTIVFYCWKKFFNKDDGRVDVACSWDEVVDSSVNFAKEIALQWELDVQDITGGAWEVLLQRLEEDVAIVEQRFYFKGNDDKYYRENVYIQIPIEKVPAELVTELNKQPSVDITEHMRQDIQEKISLESSTNKGDVLKCQQSKLQ